MSYKQARSDFEYLDSVIEIDDTVDQMAQLEPFMKTPTKAFAAHLYYSMIYQWFVERGKDCISCGKRVKNYNCDAKTKKIAKRYNLDISHLMEPKK